MPVKDRPYFNARLNELKAHAETDRSGVIRELTFRKSNAAKLLFESLTGDPHPTALSLTLM